MGSGRNRRLILVGFVAALLAHERDAAAQLDSTPPKDPWQGWSLAVQGQTGLMTPLGPLGLQFDLSPSRWFSLQGGVGYSRVVLSSCGHNDAQFAVGPRLRVPVVAGFGVSTGLTFSWGDYGTEDGCPFEQGDIHDWNPAYWLNWDVALEYRWQIGIVATMFTGYGGVLNADQYVCTNRGTPCPVGPNPRDATTAFFGATFGFWIHLGDG